MILENKYVIIIVDLAMFRKMVTIFFLIDVCTRHRKMSNYIYFNILTVSVMGHKHVFELIPIVFIYIMITIKQLGLFAISGLKNFKKLAFKKQNRHLLRISFFPLIITKLGCIKY